MRAFLFLAVHLCLPLYLPTVHPTVYPWIKLELRGYRPMKRSEIKRRPLSDTVLAGLEPDTKEYREQDGNGLYFRVKPDGQKSWCWR